MRRRLLAASALLAALPMTAACSSSGAGVAAPASATATPTDTPTDTASPLNTGTPTPTPLAASPTEPATPTVPGEPDLPGCMIGTWTAPIAREFGHLGVNKQSDGMVTSGTGTLVLAFVADHTFSYTFQKVLLQIPGGQAKVVGPVRGTWRLTGNNLHTAVTSSQVQTSVTMAGFDLGEDFDDVIRSLTPNGVTVTCRSNGLELLLPGSQGGGAVMFDKA